MADCELCSEAKRASAFWQNDLFYLIDASCEATPNFVRLVLKRHVPEMSDLPREERVRVWDALNAIEEAMREVLSPAKVNLAEFGNMVPHLHWHLIARYRDDMYFPESTWSNAVRGLPAATAERLARNPALFKRIAEKLA